MFDERLPQFIASLPLRYLPLFLMISGAHLYGFPSPDSDYDIRGVYVLPSNEVVGLFDGPESIVKTWIREDLTLDVALHDIKKFLQLLLNKNGLALEHLFAPTVLSMQNADDIAELRELARPCISRYHSYHYTNFAKSQWKRFQQEERHVKPLLYIYRVLLTGIHLMRTGEVETNLTHLQSTFGTTQLSYLTELIEWKQQGSENVLVNNCQIDFYYQEYLRLQNLLQEEATRSHLPAGPTQEQKQRIHNFLIRLRLGAK